MSPDDMHQAFLMDIAASPAADLPRLAYADWLEENDHPHQAEFIRVQFRTPAATLDDHARFGTGFQQPLDLHWRKRCKLDLWRHGDGLPDFAFQFACERGFPWLVVTDIETWLDHGPEVILYNPLTRVRLHDRQPGCFGSCWGWTEGDDWRDAPYLLPTGLFERLPRAGPEALSCNTSLEAINALSVACLKWARFPDSTWS